MDHDHGMEPLPLATTVSALRSDQLAPADHFARVRERIERLDGRVRAFVDEPGRWERLNTEVASLVRAHAADPTDQRPPLYGAQTGVKDIVHVDGLPTQAGARLPADVLTGAEASVVKRLRAAGALVTGKTVSAEFAYREPGETRNPHAPAHTPGGSSSGSAAAVAAGMCPLAIGSQTVGSVIRPAAFCGVVGFKPSFGRIPIDGVIMNAPSFDTLGVFTTDVAGAAVAAATVCDGWDGARVPDRRPVLGVPAPEYLNQADAVGTAAFQRQVDALVDAGYEVSSSHLLGDIDQVNERHRLMNVIEMARVHADWFERFGERYRPQSAQAIEWGRAIDAEVYDRARAEHAEFRGRVEEEMTRAGIDVWICPSAAGPAPRSTGTTGDGSMNLPWSHAGMPAVTVPADWVAAASASDGADAAGSAASAEPGEADLMDRDVVLPVGLQCVGRFGADEELLSWARDIAAVLS